MDIDGERGIPHREGDWTFTISGTTDRQPFASLDENERTRHKGELIYPNVLIRRAADHVAAFRLWPRDAEHTTIDCDFLFHPSEIAKDDFDPSDAVDFWDLVNRQDWTICEGVQRGMRSRVFETGSYAPVESWSLHLRRAGARRSGPGPPGPARRRDPPGWPRSHPRGCPGRRPGSAPAPDARPPDPDGECWREK